MVSLLPRARGAWAFVLAGLVIAITSGTVPATFSTSSDFNRFAAFYVVAQAIERLIEVFSPLVPPEGDDTRRRTPARSSSVRSRSSGVAIARWTGLLFLQRIGWTSPSSWLDVIVTGLVLSGGTKALHDLIAAPAKRQSVRLRRPNYGCRI